MRKGKTMRDQKKSGCCRQQADAETKDQAAVAATHGCGCDNKAHGKETAEVTAAQSGETTRGKQSCCC